MARNVRRVLKRLICGNVFRMEDSEEIRKPLALTIAQTVLGCTSALFLITVSVAFIIEPFTFSKLMFGALLGVLPAFACIFLSKRSPFARYFAAIALACQLTYIFRFYEVWFISPNSVWGIQDVFRNATIASLFFGVGAVGLVLLSLIYLLLANKSVRGYMSPPETTDEQDAMPTPKYLFDGIDDDANPNNPTRDSVEYV
jgi:hypothetical protein